MGNPAINPYVGRMTDHPQRLLGDSNPQDLRRLMEAQRAKQEAKGLLHVELGAGSGNFLAGLAMQNPQDQFVGFELRFKRLVKAADKLERAGLDNVWYLREIGELFHSYFEPGQIDRFYIQFPDPWAKPSQWKHRMVSRPLLDRLAVAMAPGGIFQFKTDHSGYFLHVLALIQGRADFELAAFSNDLHRSGLPAAQARTEFENLFRAQGRPVYYLALRRAGGVVAKA